MDLMRVKKRNGSFENVSFDKVLKRIKKQSSGLKVNFYKVAQSTINGLFDGVTTLEIDQLLSETAFSYVTEHPDYSNLAARILVSRLHKETYDDFLEYTTRLYQDGKLNDSYYEKVLDNIENINSAIDYDKDYEFEYFGLRTLFNGYLLAINKSVVERPQQMYMRVALTLFDDWDDIKDYYERLSREKYRISSATPINYNSGTKKQNLASCVLIKNQGDSVDELCDTYKETSKWSAAAAGIGLYMGNVRSKKSQIKTSGGMAAGVLKQLKIYNELARTYNQQGKRTGSFAIYIDAFHKDIYDVLDIRKNRGAEELRARDLFIAICINDLFMKKVMNNEKWYLFCPDDILNAGLTPLQDLYGEKFEEEYNKAVNLGLGEEINAQDLYLKICETQIETGLPYILYKDAANNKTNHQNIGTLLQSNLCIEILQYTAKDIVAICNLSSIPLQTYIDKNKFNFVELRNSTKKIVRALNNSIDRNHYATESGRKGALSQRAIAIGVQGLADAFVMLKLPYESDEASKLNKEIFENIYFAALEESCLIAKEKGKTYDYFENSPTSKGILQYDMWGLTEEVETNSYLNWKSLKEDIKKYGLYNSLLTGQMPTQSSANILGSTEGTEAFPSNIYRRNVLSGEFVIMNKYLVKDLESLNLWNDEVRNNIILNDGSIQWLSDIYKDIKDLYKTIWEIDTKKYIQLVADRAPFIDQTQSMNLYINNPDINALAKIHMYTWKLGLKTGIYYLRGRSATTSQKSLAGDFKSSTVNSISVKPTEEEINACSIEAMRNGEECAACSA